MTTTLKHAHTHTRTLVCTPQRADTISSGVKNKKEFKFFFFVGASLLIVVVAVIVVAFVFVSFRKLFPFHIFG